MNAQRYGRLGLLLANALLGAAFTSAAFAQSAATGTAASPTPLYRIEIIVFANREGAVGEEDFAHIARRESSETASGPSEINVFDFAPYVPDEIFVDDPTAENADGAEGRLIFGRDREREPDSDAGVAVGSGSSDSSGAPEAGPPGATDPLAAGAPTGTAPDESTTTSEAAEGSADAAASAAVVDPFGGGPGNAIAPFRFRLLRPDELQLVDVRRRLERSAGYTPLVHGGWIQEGLPPQQARPFDLAYLGVSSPSGTVRLHVSRFLHLTLDLDYRPFTAPLGTAGVGNGSDTAAQPGPIGSRPVPGAFGGARQALSEVEVTRRYHLNAERRMRSGEVHYFDHPLFGVIAVVQPYQPPAPPSTEGVRPAA